MWLEAETPLKVSHLGFLAEVVTNKASGYFTPITWLPKRKNKS
jgi:hypothetical protein